MSPSDITVAGRRWPLVPTVIGPELAPEDSDLTALVTVVNAAVRFDVEGLLDALRAGTRFAGSGISVEPAGDDLHVDVEHLPEGSTVDRSSVRELVARLAQLRDELGAQPPWLFREDPIWPSAHPSEREPLADLNERVEACDRDPDTPSALESRRSILAAMNASGLMSTTASGAKLQRLLRWGFDPLAGWYDAALAAARYLGSDGRRRYVPDAASEPVLGSPVCIDLFRGGLIVPASVDADEWASWGETLVAATARDADTGTFLHHDEDGWVTVRWRRDVADRPGLLGLSLGRPDEF